MGNQNSVATSCLESRIDDDLYITLSGRRLHCSTSTQFEVFENCSSPSFESPKMLKTAFSGKWSMLTPDSVPPTPRSGQFSCYDDITETLYLGYGVDTEGNTLNDVWALNTKDYVWKKIETHGCEITSRTGTTAAFFGNKIICFGGFKGQTYYSDLHTIDVTTGEVCFVKTTGDLPEARSMPIVEIINEKLVVWGGYNGNWPADLHILNLRTQVWESYKQSALGRAAVHSIVYNNKIYAYGCSNCSGILEIDPEKHTVDICPVSGSEPAFDLKGAISVRVGHYMFYMGGRSQSNWTLLYAMDLRTRWWFVFHVLPDGETVTIADGHVTEIGLFMLPQIHSSSVAYVENKREIIACLGYPQNDPPSLVTVNIGEALGAINLREDMLEAFQANL